MADHYEAIAALAFELSGELDITILTPSEDAPRGLSRAGGRGFALGDRHPIARGAPMTHLWTLATADVPALRRAYRDAAAVAMYLLAPATNEAFEIDNGQTALIALSELDVRGGPGLATREDLPEVGVIARTVGVPASAFARDPHHDSDDAIQNRLCAEIYSAGCRAGGHPIWLQDEEHDGEFLLQFDETFVNVNLGDVGVMYVFKDQQFWQCH
jgi:hypothetical protein